MEISIEKEGLILLLVLPVALISLYFLWHKGFFQLPIVDYSILPDVTGPQVLTLFGLYLLSALFIFPLIFISIYGDLRFRLQPPTQGWIETLSVILSFIIVLVTYYLIRFRQKISVWNGLATERNSSIQNLAIGIFCWPIAYFIAVVISGTVQVILEQFIVFPEDLQQVAVDYFKRTLPYPWLMATSVFAIVVLVPIQEELMFRGFLQNWARKYIGRKGAIVFTSMIFSFFHFSPEQGVINLPLLCALFPLSLLLGFLYERQGSLYASIGLHATFNASSLLLIFSTQ